MFWVCICSLSYPAKRMRRSILSHIACLAAPYFSTHDWQNFRNTVTEYKKSVLNLFKIFGLKHFAFWEEFREIVINVRYTELRAECPLFLSRCNETWIFWADFWKAHKYQVQLKSIQWESSCSMRTEGQKNTTDLIVAFPNFSKTVKRFLEATWCTLTL